ncbi:MAG: hypothetical protein LBT40_14585 [Deltaproteobacteria bacterium]|jgi:hypothetical protein|nr:hypothetical protein [Deltaproteobacteria bacterium]
MTDLHEEVSGIPVAPDGSPEAGPEGGGQSAKAPEARSRVRLPGRKRIWAVAAAVLVCAVVLLAVLTRQDDGGHESGPETEASDAAVPDSATPDDGLAGAAAPHGTLTDVPAEGGDAPAAGGDGSDGGLDPELYSRPSGVEGETLSVKEYRWCIRQLVRTGILHRFAPEGEDPASAREARVSLERWCGGTPEEGMTVEELLGPGRRLGTQVVREALAEARELNPGLAMRADAVAEFAPGGPAYADEAEVRAILEYLRLLPAGGVREAPGPDVDPGSGPDADPGPGPDAAPGPGTDTASDHGPSSGEGALRTALERFQGEVGMPVTGELDAATAGLLRNALFRHSMAPLLQSGTEEVAEGAGSGAGGDGETPDAASPAASQGSGGSGEAPEDDPEAFLDPGLYARPVSGSSAGAGKALSDKEARWCRRQLVRTDILLRFAPGGTGSDAGLAAFARMEKWCPGTPDAWTLAGKTREASGRAGILMAREAADEARAWNPELAMDAQDAEALSPGSPDAVGPEEAGSILGALGYGAGGSSGGRGGAAVASPDAVKAFQKELGLPETGELDSRTGGLLRNAMFLHSLESFGGQ